MRTQLILGTGLNVVIADRATQLSPREALTLAERLLRRATTAIIRDQIQAEIRVGRSGVQTKGKSSAR